jgi:hypothetical protein
MNTLEFLNKELNANYESIEEVNWYYISKYQKLSEDFIREFKDEVNWVCISIYQKLSKDFIREFKNKVYWNWISGYQKLSENFIREFQNKVYWGCISAYQELSEDFIKEFQDKVDWLWISESQKLSEDFLKEFNLKIDEDNWIYKTTEFKKKQVIKCGLYECHDDYFIAYKAIRNDRYSHFNFQYQYLKNGIYECHCDCTNDENSFGLSVWTEDGAKEYNNTGLIAKVKVRYEDVGRLVHNSNKVRCSKIEILD